MKEKLINLRTAKLAKEKGFNEYSTYFYTEENGLCTIDIGGKVLSILNSNGCIIKNHYDCNGNFWYKELDNGEIEYYEPIKYFAPTQSLLQKWLRENYGSNVISNVNGELSWMYTIQSLYPHEKYGGKYIISSKTFNTYEEALEEGLKKALNLIK